MKRVMIVLNIIFLTLMTVFTFKVFDGQAEVSVITSAVLLYLVEAVIFLYSFMYVSDHIKEIIVKVLKIYIIVIISLIVVIGLLNLILGWTFILYFAYRFIAYAFVIYPLFLKIFLQVTAHYTYKSQIAITGIASVLVVILLVINGILAGLTMKSVSTVKFDDTDVEFVLVEESSFFSQSHRLYIKENALFASELVASWDCESCYANIPNRYVWTWIDEDTVKISGGGLDEVVVVDLS